MMERPLHANFCFGRVPEERDSRSRKVHCTTIIRRDGFHNAGCFHRVGTRVHRGRSEREFSTRYQLCCAEHCASTNEGLVTLYVHNCLEAGELRFVGYVVELTGVRHARV